MKRNYNSQQKKLVEISERYHEKGIKHSGISGGLIEDLLITFLREDVSELNFFKGHIISKAGKSSQIDIIICDKSVEQDDCFKDFPNYINVVDLGNVFGVIEVKKWAYPKMLAKKGPIYNLRKSMKKFAPNLPLMLVAFRFHDRLRDRKYLSYFNKSGVDAYCFFGQYHTRKGKILFPTDEECWGKFDKECHYQGEYERLITQIKSLTKNGNQGVSKKVL